MVDPREVHWIAEKHILRYLKGTIEFGLQYLQGDQINLVGYSDSDWARSTTNRKSTSFPPQFSVIIKAASSYLKIQSSMIDSNTLKSYIISLGTKFKRG
jgi:hypothetical protein